jgi:hypothetical protein
MTGEVNRNELRDIRLCYFRERRILYWGRMDVGANQIAYVGGYRSTATSAGGGFAHPVLTAQLAGLVQVAGSSITSVDLPCNKSEDRKPIRFASSLTNSPGFGIISMTLSNHTARRGINRREDTLRRPFLWPD